MALAAALAGCFNSGGKPLLPPQAASAPFAQMVLTSRADHSTATYTAKGNAYYDSDGRAYLLEDLGDDWYVVQTTWGDPPSGEPGKQLYVYALAKLDRVRHTLATYGTQATPTDIGPGRRNCGIAGNALDICIDDLSAYAAYLQEQAWLGRAPDGVFDVVTTPNAAASPVAGWRHAAIDTLIAGEFDCNADFSRCTAGTVAPTPFAIAIDLAGTAILSRGPVTVTCPRGGARQSALIYDVTCSLDTTGKTVKIAESTAPAGTTNWIERTLIEIDPASGTCTLTERRRPGNVFTEIRASGKCTLS